MTYARFIDFLDKVQDGSIRDDAAYRAYAVDEPATSTRLHAALRYLDRALSKDIGIATSQVTAAVCDVRGPGSARLDLRSLLVAWYNWQRIVSGELVQWKLRNTRNCPASKAPSPNEGPDTVPS